MVLSGIFRATTSTENALTPRSQQLQLPPTRFKHNIHTQTNTHPKPWPNFLSSALQAFEMNRYHFFHHTSK